MKDPNIVKKGLDAKKERIYPRMSQECACGCGILTKVGNKFINGHHRRGEKQSYETRLKMSKAQSGTNNFMYGMTGDKHPFWGKHHTPEACLKISLGHTGMSMPSEIKNKISKKLTGCIKSRETRIKMCKATQNRWERGVQISWAKGLTKETDKRLRKFSERNYKLWKDPEYVAKQMKSRGVKPNKLELSLEKFLNELQPNEWKYVGDGQLIIGGKCPDFVNINGQKKIIELWGSYWHEGQNPEDRMKVFEPFGYKTLVVWESELKDMNILKNRIEDFYNG